MPPKRSKRIAQKAGQVDPLITTVLTPKQITTALAQLMEGQRQTQQQIEALLALQNNPQQAESQLEGTDRGWEPSCTQLRARAHLSHTKDAR